MTDSRGREDRQTEVRAERRRRDDATIDGSQRLKLAIPLEIEERLKAERRIPRWVNDEGNRMHNLTKLDDYDKVEGVEPIFVGTSKDGKPILAHLCSKPEAFIEEDKAKAEKRRRTLEQAMLDNEKPDDPAADRADFYVDDESQIKQGRRTLRPSRTL